MYKELLVPENELKDVITELLEYCDVKNERGELGKTKFSSPVSEEKIDKWEKENGVRIPETYKQWLRFTGDCIIDGTTAEFYSPKNFRTEYVPEDLVIIGEQIGDGEVICFSKERGNIVTYFEGSINYEYGTFDKTLKEVVRLMGKPEEVKEETELERLKRKRNNIMSNLDGSARDARRWERIKEFDEKIKALEG
ncbi:MAG: SMI1/KNR4 family protein [Pseudobutyrivibrio sp.]|nr:SMI1/KNR4 family protein [Pseudobutyrivibrio sp.]